jgi:uroporphyrin-III C-methyltransferase
MPIYVVGAGPGDPNLLTVKAVELLRRADVVAYGDLVPEEVVERYAPQARRVKIGHKREDHDKTVERLIDEAARGLNVVVLKNGDPTVFGRGVQICKKAEARGVPCSVVPGVSAFTAAAALHGIELTDGASLRHIALFSFPHFDAETLAKIAADTVVVHMMSDRLETVMEAVEKICGAEVKIYVCHAVSLGGTCVKTTVGELPSFKGKRPLLIIIQNCIQN